MSWFRKKKEESEWIDIPQSEGDGMTPVFIPVSQLLRSVVYDAGFANPEDVIVGLGMQRISPDVAEMEQDASDARIDAVEPLAPFLQLAAALLAKATVAYSTSTLDEELTDEMVASLADQFQRIALGSSVSAIASLLDSGLIRLNGEAVGLGPDAESLPDDWYKNKWGGSQ